MLVHPSDLYVGLKSERIFVQQGEPLVVSSIVTDLDGKLVAGREVQHARGAARLDYEVRASGSRSRGGRRGVHRASRRADAVECTFRPKEGGVYRVTARVYDDRERPNESELTLWVAGGKKPPARDVEQEKVELIPDRKEYRAGDTAEILVQSPFFPAEGLLTLRRSGIVSTERFRMNEPSHTLRVPHRGGLHAEHLRAGRPGRRGRAHGRRRASRMRSCRSGRPSPRAS